ncbi:MAG: sugar phosphate isomerase/epimerase family protein [Oscillospiraceae bacterium]
MMYDFPIGVLLESFRADVKESLEAAVEVGASAIQVSATKGILEIETVTTQKRDEFKKMVEANGLTISAVCGDFICGNKDYSFSEKANRAVILDKSKRILDLAKEIGTNIVTTHIGVVPSDPNCDKYKIVQETCHELATYADSLEAHFAIETGPEIAVTLKAFLDSLHSKGVAVNLDPANFVMVTGDDPVKAVHTLKDYIVHTHAKDGRRLIIERPEVIYGEIEAEIQNARYFTELPLGEGDVDFKNYVQALDDIGYRGYLTIEREVGGNPKGDIITAVNFLNAIKRG